MKALFGNGGSGGNSYGKRRVAGGYRGPASAGARSGGGNGRLMAGGRGAGGTNRGVAPRSGRAGFVLGRNNGRGV